jgi:hypothetical protein
VPAFAPDTAATLPPTPLRSARPEGRALQFCHSLGCLSGKGVAVEKNGFRCSAHPIRSHKRWRFLTVAVQRSQSYALWLLIVPAANCAMNDRNEFIDCMASITIGRLSRNFNATTQRHRASIRARARDARWTAAGGVAVQKPCYTFALTVETLLATSLRFISDEVLLCAVSFCCL